MITFGEITDQLYSVITTAKQFLPVTLGTIGILFVVHIVNVILKRRLNFLGIVPRHALGLPGIVCSPFLHADFGHLLFNSVPLFLLSNLLILYGLHTYIFTAALLVVSSGFLTWVFGRKAVHIGASGYIMALWGFLLVISLQNIGVITIFTIFICIYYLGGLIFSIVPAGKHVSWEGHLLGLIAGVGWGLLLTIPNPLSHNIYHLWQRF